MVGEDRARNASRSDADGTRRAEGLFTILTLRAGFGVRRGSSRDVSERIALLCAVGQVGSTRTAKVSAVNLAKRSIRFVRGLGLKDRGNTIHSHLKGEPAARKRRRPFVVSTPIRQTPDEPLR
jgi:hypothetical protein